MCDEGDVVAVVERDFAFEGTVTLQFGPALAIGRLHFVVALPVEGEWLRSLKLPKTRQEFGSILTKCEAFLKTRKADALNKITDGDVMAWRSELQKTMADSTINKKMTCMSSYFEHVRKHGVIKNNPFRGKWLEVEAERKRRRFTLEEVAILFDSADAKMRDEMALALLGMRISEQWNLQVKHVESIDGMTVLHVPDALLPVIGRLTAGKKAGEYLCEAPPAAKLKSRGSEPGRRWMRWLREVQKDHGLPDEVDWHSWRRLAAWLMETADVPESTAARILGHSSRLGLSYGLYAGKAELKKLKTAADSAMGVLPASVLKHLKARKAARSSTKGSGRESVCGPHGRRFQRKSFSCAKFTLAANRQLRSVNLRGLMQGDYPRQIMRRIASIVLGLRTHIPMRHFKRLSF